MTGSFLRGVGPFLLAVLILFAGCELVSEPPVVPDFRPASTLVINEVFALPQSHPSTYCWIEFLNPTSDTVDLANWTISFYTSRLRDSIVVSLDSTGLNLLAFHGEFIFFDSLGVLDVPFASEPLAPPVRLPPNGLYTIVNNEARLEDHTRWGPADERYRRETRDFFGRQSIQGPIGSVDTLFYSPGVDSITISVTLKSYDFFIQPKEQLILKDPAGRIVDVVRMGDSVYTNMIGDSAYSDPLLGPSNRSIGPVPEFESVSRYAGGYFTENTANDFYITRPTLRPIPHWYSQLYKR